MRTDDVSIDKPLCLGKYNEIAVDGRCSVCGLDIDKHLFSLVSPNSAEMMEQEVCHKRVLGLKPATGHMLLVNFLFLMSCNKGDFP